MSNNITIGQLAVRLLESGKSAKQTLEAVKRVFPECKTTMKCIYYYSSKAKVRLVRTSAVDQDELASVLQELNG